MNWRIAIAAGIALALAGCSDLPRDPGGTTDEIRRSHVIRVGEIEGVPPSSGAQATLDKVAAKLGARIERVPGHGEELLAGLEEGKVDLVYGHFAQNSPWSANVHFGNPQGPRDEPASDRRVPRFAFRNGENGWIGLVEEAGQ